MMKHWRCLACTLLLVASLHAQASEFYGKVIAVLDGDTLLVLKGVNRVKVRLAGIDAPEKAQPHGEVSRDSLAKLVMKKQVRVASRAVDDYGRLVASVYVDGLEVNHEQVRRGMAWEFSRHSGRDADRLARRESPRGRSEIAALQHEAQQARRGLWAQADAIEPSQWRRQHPVTSPAALPLSGCGSKRHCQEMSSCAEANHYLKYCGIKALDGNGDGVPCENLCTDSR